MELWKHQIGTVLSCDCIISTDPCMFSWSMFQGIWVHVWLISCLCSFLRVLLIQRLWEPEHLEPPLIPPCPLFTLCPVPSYALSTFPILPPEFQRMALMLVWLKTQKKRWKIDDHSTIGHDVEPDNPDDFKGPSVYVWLYTVTLYCFAFFMPPSPALPLVFS